MKKLRNLYFILGLFALVFALLTRHIPGVTATDFIRGFCYGLASALFIAGIVTATIPYFYRNDKHGKKATHAHAETKDVTPSPEPSDTPGDPAM